MVKNANLWFSLGKILQKNFSLINDAMNHNTPNESILADNNLKSIKDLNSQLVTKLKNRLKEDKNYLEEEILKVSKLQHRLFPEGFELSTKDATAVRSLCTLSQTDLKPVRAISSHRKYIGPLIVALKKATWPMIKFHLTNSFKGISQFNSWAVFSISNIISKQHSLEQRVLDLESQIKELKTKQ